MGTTYFTVINDRRCTQPIPQRNRFPPKKRRPSDEKKKKKRNRNKKNIHYKFESINAIEVERITIKLLYFFLRIDE